MLTSGDSTPEEPIEEVDARAGGPPAGPGEEGGEVGGEEGVRRFLNDGILEGVEPALPVIASAPPAAASAAAFLAAVFFRHSFVNFFAATTADMLICSVSCCHFSVTDSKGDTP
ncbi:hypothetical protein TeGR_g5163, partial [Tetraparma gracilis]